MFVRKQDDHLSASQRVATRNEWFSAMSPLPRMQLIHYLFNNAVQTSYDTWHVKNGKSKEMWECEQPKFLIKFPFRLMTLLIHCTMADTVNFRRYIGHTWLSQDDITDLRCYLTMMDPQNSCTYSWANLSHGLPSARRRSRLTTMYDVQNVYVLPTLYQCFVWISEQISITSLYCINRVVLRKVRRTAKSDY